MSAKPDVLIIMTDQLNPYCLGYAGDPVVRTPHIDRLAREGVVFEHAYTVSPVCMPARCSFISGLYPHNHGFYRNFTDMIFPASLATLFRDMKGAGYSTAHIGKSHYFNPEWGEDVRAYSSYFAQLGLDHVIDISGPHLTPFSRGAYTEHLRESGLLDTYLQHVATGFAEGSYVVSPCPIPAEDHNDSFVGRKAVEFIAGCGRERPFCLFTSFPGPHNPMDAPGEYGVMYDPQAVELPPNVPHDGARSGNDHYDRAYLRRIRANYYGKISLIDHWVGRIIAALERRGTWHNTLVFFTADHGDNMGAHGRLAKNTFNDESARVPLILRWPGYVMEGSRTPALVDILDVYPTVVEVASGVRTPGRFGHSLLPVAKGEAESTHDAVFSEIGPLPHYMVRTPRFKWWLGQGQDHLYDMDADPFEMDDLAPHAQYDYLRHEMRGQLAEFMLTTQYDMAWDYRPLFERAHISAGSSDTARRLFLLFKSLQDDNRSAVTSR